MHPIQFFLRSARRCPEAVAVEADEGTLTYRALCRKIEALACALQAIDSQPLSRVGICARNRIDHLVAWLAVLAAEKTWIPLFPGNAAAEINRCIAFTEASIVLADADGLALIDAPGATVIPIADAQSGSREGMRALIERFAGDFPSRGFPSLDGAQAIKFTGGTTGQPKGVCQPFRAWNTNIATQLHCYGLRSGDRYFAAAPITHGTSTYILPTLAVGGTVVLADRPKPVEVLQALAERDITTVFVPPTVIYMMMAEPGVEALNFPRLRHLIYGAGPMRPDEIGRAQAIFGPVVASTYGQTEAPQIATFISAYDLKRPEKRAAVGRATMLTQVETMDREGRLLPPGEEGEVVIRGDLVMTGYWNQPEKTAETLVGGWLHTGDIGVFDEEGFLFLKGRLKDLVITGGFNVYPADVEPVLGRHPAVQDCAIYGVPDVKWGEALHAAVELRPGKDVGAAELIAFVKAELGSFKAPKAVRFYEALPRNAYGKLQKHELIAAEQQTPTRKPTR